MNEFYSAIATGASVFAAGICVFTPTISQAQAVEDCLREIRPGAGPPNKPADIFREFRRRELERRPASGADAPALRLLLDRAGFGRVSVRLFLAAGLISGAVCGALSAALLGRTPLLSAGACAAAGFAAGLSLLPLYALRRKKKRETALVNSMPDAMDLLAAATASGLGFDSSVRCMAERDDSPFIQELMIVLSDIRHGMSRRDAYAAMAQRCRLDEISAFTFSVIRASETGISVSEVLRQQAEQLRDARLLRAEDAVNRAAVKIMLPLVTCIFPSIFIVLLGPAVMSVAAMLQ